MKYEGSCHCGKISYEIEGEITQVAECNCSICSNRGYLLWMVPRQKLHLLTGENNLTTYTFNTHQIKHRFCPTCGSGIFGEGINPKTNAPMAAINVRCLDNVNTSILKRIPFDGKSL